MSSGLQSSNVAGFNFKSHSLSSANPSFFIQTMIRDLDALKQSPEHKLHGPINQSPSHLTLLVHSRYVFGVKRMSQRSVFGGLRSQKIVRNCWPAPHSDEHCSLLEKRVFQLKVIRFCFQLRNVIQLNLNLIKAKKGQIDFVQGLREKLELFE